MLSTKKAIILFAVIFLVQSRFELCFDLNPADLNNLHQAPCKAVAGKALPDHNWFVNNNVQNR